MRLGIISATGTASKRTIPALVGSAFCRVEAVHGRNTEKLSELSQKYNIPNVYTDPRDMLEQRDFDAVFIGSPPFLHREHVALCAEYQMPIICEKPLAQNLAEGFAIGDILGNNPGLPFMVAHHLRHQPLFNDIKDIIRGGTMGDIKSVNAQWGYMMNPQSPNAQWKTDPDLGGGGTFNDNGVHMIDFVLGLFGAPSEVGGYCYHSGYERTFGHEMATLSYGGGMTVSLESSWVMKSPNNLIISGTKGSISAYGSMGEKSTPVLHLTVDGKESTIEYPEVNLFGAEIRSFYERFFGDGTATVGTTFEEAILALRIIDGIRESSAAGGVSLPLN